MSAERGGRLGRILDEASSQPPEERSAFLAAACAGDVELRQQVEMLLSSDIGASRSVFGEPEGARLGRVVGAYRLLAHLGHGGMGEVFLAEDARLGRKVALKLLPTGLMRHPERIHRFQREARTASALNHPNILTIHDFGEYEGQPYICSELVQGLTLRELISETRMKVRDAVDAAAQICEALVAAHAAGIVHRDIKPENVMLRPDGYAKVLDFGLAKLTEPSSDDSGDRDTPWSAFDTRTGRLLGTVSYMSPEQARGESVDPRTDLFSLGVVLYEMVAGRRPFEGAMHSRVLAAILEEEPPALTASAPEAPAELQRIVSRALAKARDERYPSAAEMLLDLQSLRRQLEVDASPSGDAGGGRRQWHRAGLAAGLVGAAAIGVALLFGRSGAPPSRDRMQLTKLTTDGNVLFGAFSADGKYAAYAMNSERGNSVWVKQVATGSSLQVLPWTRRALWALAISPDDTAVYYIVSDESERGAGVLYQVPIFGGTSRELIRRITGLSVSPDGRRLVFSRWQRETKRRSLMIANIDGSDETTWAEGTATRDILAYGWSPDGKTIAYVLTDQDALGAYWEVAEKPVAGGSERTILARRRQAIRGLAWLPDRSGLVIGAEDEASGFHQLWLVSYPDGAITRITHDLTDYGNPMVTSDGSALLTWQQSRPDRVWVEPLGDPSRARPITPGTGDYGEIAFAPDGRLVYVRESNGEWDLCSVAADGSGFKQLTSGAGVNLMPDVTPDGRYIVFQSTRSGTQSVWRMDIDGEHPLQLTSDEAYYPQCSGDSRWVVYQHSSSAKSTIQQVSIDGGDPVELTTRDSARPALSPDGKWLAFEDLEAPSRRRVVVQAMAGSSPVRTFEIVAGYDTIRWTPDGRGLAFINAGSGEILLQPLADERPRVLVDPAHESFFSFALSRDGKRIAYTRGLLTNDMILIRNFR